MQQYMQLCKQVDDKRSVAESLHTYINRASLVSRPMHKSLGMRLYNRARLAAYEVGVYSREISQLSKMCLPPPFEELLKFITHGGIFERLQYQS